MTRGLLATLCVALVCAGCSSSEPDEPRASTTPSTTSDPDPDAQATGRTVELRYTVEPTRKALLSITLPPQKPGGTMITWSAYFSGVGNIGTAIDPLKVECYVVQATGSEFGDRVLYVADDSATSAGDDVSISGSGLVDVKDGERLTFECELDENREPTVAEPWRTIPEQPIQVTLTPVTYERRDVTIG